ncbi:hypothetical protein [Pseudomonas phoenicis]|uniref:hypothetical protein n=1 Tax=unclassified Pseudomonas TaxID=196821 RepID=UPI0039A0BA4D
MQKTILFICCVTAVVVYTLTLAVARELAGCWDVVVSAYHTGVRGYVFAAFLGASSFLISLLTFLVINIKEKMFDSSDYLKLYVMHMNLSEGDSIPKKDLYKPLRLITSMLVIAIFLCIVSSVTQLTLGFSDSKVVLLIPTFIPFLAVSFLTSSLFQIYSLIKQWLSADDSFIVVSQEHL